MNDFWFRSYAGPRGTPAERRHCRGGSRRSDSHSRRDDTQQHRGRGRGRGQQRRSAIQASARGRSSRAQRWDRKEEKSSPRRRVGQLGRDEEIARLLRENLELRIRAEIQGEERDRAERMQERRYQGTGGGMNSSEQHGQPGTFIVCFGKPAPKLENRQVVTSRGRSSLSRGQ